MCAERGNHIYDESKQVCTWCCTWPFSLTETAAQLASHSGAWLGYGTCHMKSCINSTKTRRANKSSHLAAVFLNASQSVFGSDIKQPPCGGGREQRDWWHHSVHPPGDDWNPFRVCLFLSLVPPSSLSPVLPVCDLPRSLRHPISQGRLCSR